MSRKKYHDDDFTELAMKITDDRATWTLRAWVLAGILKRHGIDAEFVLRADKKELVELMKEPTNERQSKQSPAPCRCSHQA